MSNATIGIFFRFARILHGFRWHWRRVITTNNLQMNWLHFGRNCTRNNGARQKIRINIKPLYCYVANDIKSTNGTLRPQGWRVHYTTWCTTARRQYQLSRSALRMGTDAIITSTSVRDLGIFIDTDLSMRSHVQRTVASCFVVLRQLRSIRRSVPSPVYQTLVVALALTRLDYCNATLAGIPATLINSLQSARLVSRTLLPVATG